MQTPFNPMDDALFNIARAVEPWTIHLEIAVEGTIDADRLRDAIETAVKNHPMARAQVAPYHAATPRHAWEILDSLDAPVLQVADMGSDDAALALYRNQVASQRLGVETAPGFMFHLVHHRTGDRLMLALDHALADGLSAVRLFASVVRRYGRHEDPLPAVDPLAVRDLRSLARADSAGKVVDRLRLLVEHLAVSVTSPGRVARQTDNTKAEEGAPGYGCLALTFSKAETKAFIARRVKPATVNDLLLAGTLVAIDEWNARHGESSQRLSVLMPVNLRPADWWFEVFGNLSSYVSVKLNPADHHDLAAATAAVQSQTERLKQASAEGVLIDVLQVPRFLPAIIKRQLRQVMPTIGANLVETTWVSNLGPLKELPAMGNAGAVTDIQFSPPAPMPMGFALGAAYYEGRLSLCLRYRDQQFDERGANAFGELLRRTLLPADA